MTWKNSVNNSSSPMVLSVDTFLLNNNIEINLSSIDIFYNEIEKYKILLTNQHNHILVEHHCLNQLLVIGFISCTENYFRDICTKIINICPISRELTSEKTIQFGSVLWHLNTQVTRGVFENKSFSDSKEIKKVLKENFNIDLKNDLNIQLENFEKVCQLRHAVVHSNNILAGKNAINLKLAITNTNTFTIFNPSIINLQDILYVCIDLVREVNNILFENLCHRWATNWRSMPSWISADENKNFKKIWNSFYSIIDANNSNILNNISATKCKNLIKKQYGL